MRRLLPFAAVGIGLLALLASFASGMAWVGPGAKEATPGG
jgi:hypothetical protein